MYRQSHFLGKIIGLCLIFLFGAQQLFSEGLPVIQGKEEQERKEVTSPRVSKKKRGERKALKTPPAHMPGEYAKEVIAATNIALDDEQKVYLLYRSYLDELGPVRPFDSLARSEKRHVRILKRLLRQMNAPVSAHDIQEINEKMPKDRQEACQFAMRMEEKNVANYEEKLIPLVKNFPEVKKIFQNLSNSTQSHLKALKRCAAKPLKKGRPKK